MTRVLVINCSLDRSSRIEELLKGVRKFSECSAILYRDICAGYRVDEGVDAIIISGSKARIVNQSHRDLFEEIISLISHVNIPILGICYGHQLICWSLGCEMASLDEPMKDKFEEVHVLEVDELFEGFEEHQAIPLAQSHYDYVRKESLEAAGLVLLADSDSCEVEAVKQRDKAFYGVQFHPERITIRDRTCLEGYRVIENFFKNVVKR